MKKSDIDRILGRSAKEKENTSRRDDDLNAASRVGLTALDVIGNVGKGAVKTLEGIYDEGATLVGAVGGIFDSDFKDDVAEHIKYDATDKVFDSMGFDYVEDNSYLEGNKVGEFTRGVSSGIGGMLPSVALGFIPGAGPVLAPVSMGVGAAGQATESALNKGAGYYSSAAYGVGMGLVEGATEALGGYMLGGGNSLIGKVLAGTKLGKFTSKGIGKVAETFISEGSEEVITDYADVGMQFVTGVDKDWRKNLDEANKGAFNTFATGGTVGSFMQGGNVTMNALRNRNRGGFKATRADESFNYIKEVSKNYGEGKSNAKYDNAIEGALNDISRELTSMSPEARKNYMAEMGAFKNAFNAEDGSIKMDLRANINEGAVSNGLRGISGVLAHKPVSYDTEISEGASKAKTVVEKLLGEGANVVITSDSVENNAFYNVDEGIVYINNNAEFKGEEIAEFVATHEVAHITEGTREYLSLNKVLEEIATDQRVPSALKSKIGNIAKRQIEIGELYKEQMANMTPEQQAYLIRTELNADLVGTLLGDDYFIEKLAQRDASLVKKIFNHLKGLTKKSTTIDKGSAKYLNKLVGKFGKAIDKSQGGVKISQLGREDEETEQSEETGIRFSKSKNEYPYDMQKVIEGYINSVDERILNQAELQRRNKNTEFKRLEVCAVDSEFVDDIADLYNMDIADFTININSNAFNHIEKRHGENGEADKSMANLKDVARVGFVISNRDSLEPLTYKDEQVYSKEFSTKEGTPAPMMLIKKKINGTYYCAIAVTDAKYKKVWVQTAFINKRDGLTQILHDEISSLSLTSETVPVSHPSNDIILENGEKINTFDKKIDDERKSISKSSKNDFVFEAAENGGVRVSIPNPELEKMQKRIDSEKARKESFDALLEETGTLETETRYENDNATDEERFEQAEKQARQSLDYWVRNGDFTQGSVKYIQNGKVKVKLAQTANEAQLVKYINNHIMDKKYSNKDVKNIIDDILTNSNIWGGDWEGSYKGMLKGETMKNVKKMLWAALNTAPEGERIGPALDIADYIVKYGILAETVEVTEDVLRAHEILDALEPYKHNIDISHIRADIKSRYDKDNTPNMTWALKKDAKGRGYTADEVAQALEEIGIELSGDRGKLINEADIFIAIHELCKQAHKTIKEAAPLKANIAGVFDGKESYQLKQKIAREILDSYDKYGQETTFTKVEKKYQKQIESLKKRVKDVHEENKIRNAVLYEVQKIKDSKSGKYHNATQVQEQALSGLKGVLSKIKYRSDINRSSTRAIMKELAAWYTEDNPVLRNFAVDKDTSESRGLYNPYIKSLIDLFLIEDEESVGKPEKPLDVSELYVLNQILHHLNFVFESYGKIWRGGRWVEATDVASEQLNILMETRENETTVGRLFKQRYFNFFMDPELVCTRLDGHEKKGYFTTLLEDLRQADIKQRHDEMLALQRYDEFEKKHKKYIKELMSEKNTIKVGNIIDHHAEGGPTADILEIPRYAALDLYMVSKTRGALQTFEQTGWVLRLDSNKKDFEKPQATITEAQIKGIEAQLSKEDLELIEIMEEQYNVNLRRLKYDTDMIRLGMSNVFDGYYYPINRISANNLDSNDFFFDLERVSNSSFNNSRVKGAKQAIIVSNVLTKFKKHVNGVTRYANLSIPIENMTKLLNIDVGDNANMPQSITVFLHKTTDGKKAEGYIKTLIKDVQQINIQTDDSTKVVSFLRGAYAKSTLGFNPKVLFTQASSYIAGFGELRGSSLAYGIANIYKQKGLDAELDKYCPWAAVRHYEKGTTHAMTVTDKVNKFGDFFTKGIEFMDRQIVKLEFLACQKEAQARFNLKIGTEENKIKAGELLQELGLKTQQNQLTTEKSAAMRSPNEFAKTLTMFKADSMKQVSRFLQSISAISVLKKKMDAAKRVQDTARYDALEIEYKRAKKSFCKYSVVIIASSVYMVLLARLFNKLYHKEEEDENKVLGFFEDLFGNICGMVPIISELYAFFVDGFEVNSFLYSTINNAMDAVKGTTELVSGIVNGENITSEDAMTKIRKLAYSIGALAGLPAKNVYKNTKAIVDIISPSFGDRVDSWFKEPSQKELEEKIEAGIEKGDDKAVSVSLSLLYDKYDLELKDNVLRQEYDRLMRLEMTKGEDDETKYLPLEAKIPDSIKIDDEEVELTRKDVNVFKNAFGEAEKSQAKIVKTVTYKKLNDEQRAYALRKISQYYYEDTRYTYTGEKSNFAYYAKVVGVESLALILAYAKGLKGDARLSRREKIEAYIKSLRLNSMQTSLALRCLGYGDKENDKVVASYVSRASVLTKEERAEMLEIIK